MASKKKATTLKSHLKIAWGYSDFCQESMKKTKGYSKYCCYFCLYMVNLLLRTAYFWPKTAKLKSYPQNW